MTKDDFALVAYINDDPIRAALHALGFHRRFMDEDGVEDTILELIDNGLDYLKRHPTKTQAETSTGRICVNLKVTDENDEGVLRIVPSISLDIWSW